MRRGFTLLQTLLGLFIGGLIAAIVFQQLVTLYVGQQINGNINAANADARAAIDAMVDHARNASSCGSATNGVLNSVLEVGTATSFTYYGDTNCTDVRYALSGTNLVRTENNVNTTVARNVSALTLTYYKATTYNTAWTTTTNPNVPTTAELPYVCGILVDVTTNNGGLTAHFTTTVRLRNAPKKTNLDGL